MRRILYTCILHTRITMQDQKLVNNTMHSIHENANKRFKPEYILFRYEFSSYDGSNHDRFCIDFDTVALRSSIFAAFFSAFWLNTYIRLTYMVLILCHPFWSNFLCQSYLVLCKQIIFWLYRNGYVYRPQQKEKSVLWKKSLSLNSFSLTVTRH